jgi:MobA/MobL family
MAIAFARARALSRSKGGNAVRTAAYNARTTLTDERTGLRYSFKDRGTLEHHEILLPVGAGERFRDATALWPAVEFAERRRDSCVARELVLPLPADREITSDDRVALARSFAEEHFVSKGLAVQIDLHLPHPPKPGYLRLYRGENEGNDANGGWFTTDLEKAGLYGAVSYIDVSRADLLHFAQGHGGPDEWVTDDAAIRARPRQTINYHAHLLVTTRRIEGDRLNDRKAVDLEPHMRAIGGRPIVVEAEQWGEVWKQHQDSYFGGHNKGITVDPVAPIPGEHIGPVRFRHPKDHRLQTAEQVRQLNAKIASDPAAVAEHLGPRPFDGRALSRFLSKHLDDPKERESVAADVHTRLHNLQREALEKASWADKVQSGLRPLSVEDVARQLNPEYARLLKEASELRDDARKADWIRTRQTADKEAGAYRVNERWSEMGVARRALHLVGSTFPSLAGLRDIELDRWSSLNKQGAWAEERWAIRGAAISGGAISGGAPGSPTGDLQVVMRQAAMELEKIRPQAEQELERRQKVARNARATLANLEQRDKLIARRRRSYSRGPSP